MEQINIPSLATISETPSQGSFAIEPLFPGYGSTLGNALRRVLLSSLEGAAVDRIQIEGVDHEFSTIEGMKEDIIHFLLYVKGLRFSLNSEEAELHLIKKGQGMVTGADFEKNPDCEVVNPEHHLATLDKGAVLDLRVFVKRGRGYEPVEKKENRDKTVGVITTDSIFSPVLAVSYKVENTRVGQITNFDRLTLDITTDGSVAPQEALKTAAKILTEQYAAIANIDPDSFNTDEEVSVPKEEIIVTDDSLQILHSIDAKTKVEDAGFSGRTSHALSTAGYKTLSGLKRLSDIKLQSIKGLGAKGLEEVKAVLDRVE